MMIWTPRVLLLSGFFLYFLQLAGPKKILKIARSSRHPKIKGSKKKEIFSRFPGFLFFFQPKNSGKPTLRNDSAPRKLDRAPLRLHVQSPPVASESSGVGWVEWVESGRFWIFWKAAIWAFSIAICFGIILENDSVFFFFFLVFGYCGFNDSSTHQANLSPFSTSKIADTFRVMCSGKHSYMSHVSGRFEDQTFTIPFKLFLTS